MFLTRGRIRLHGQRVKYGECRLQKIVTQPYGRGVLCHQPQAYLEPNLLGSDIECVRGLDCEGPRLPQPKP